MKSTNPSPLMSPSGMIAGWSVGRAELIVNVPSPLGTWTVWPIVGLNVIEYVAATSAGVR